MSEAPIIVPSMMPARSAATTTDTNNRPRYGVVTSPVGLANVDGIVRRDNDGDSSNGDVGDGERNNDNGDLPVELWAHVLSLVQPQWRFCARRVCRQWRALIERLPMPRDLDAPSRERRLARGCAVSFSVALAIYCRCAQSQRAPFDCGDNDDPERDNNKYGDETNADNNGDDLAEYEKSPLAVDLILALGGWTRDGRAKRFIHAMDIVAALFRTGQPDAVQHAFSWLEARPLAAAACLVPSDPCAVYTSLAHALARHGRLDWMRRVECALAGFVARDHCTPAHALLSGDAAFGEQVNGATIERWYASVHLWEAAGRLGRLDTIEKLIVAAYENAPGDARGRIAECLVASHNYTRLPACEHTPGRTIHPGQTCPLVAACAAMAHGHNDVVDFLFTPAIAFEGAGHYESRPSRSLYRLFESACTAANSDGVTWCLAEAARMATPLDIVLGAKWAVMPHLDRRSPSQAVADVNQGNDDTSRLAAWKWHRGVRLIAHMRRADNGACSVRLDAPQTVREIIECAAKPKAQLALVAVYAPALAVMCARSDADIDRAFGIIESVALNAIEHAIVQHKLEMLERLVAAFDVLALHLPFALDALVARVHAQVRVSRPAGSRAHVAFIYARCRALGFDVEDAASRASSIDGDAAQQVKPWSYAAPKASWKRWWRSDMGGAGDTPAPADPEAAQVCDHHPCGQNPAGILTL